MSNILMVPTHLDALFLKNDASVVSAMADFTRLPYFNGERDVNPDVANISEDIVSQPFQNQNLHLKAGVHLHWSLPDALTKGTQASDGTTDFPKVPNCWMILRTGGNLVDKQWIVESDYLYPYGDGENAGSIVYPLEQPESTDPRFRYMGRAMTLADWQQNGNSDEYLDKLTAVGYGESSFAAFYPNCVSVFGFWDDEITSELPPEGLQYSVIGWYRDSSTDFFQTSIQETTTELGDLFSNVDLLIQLQNNFDWIVPIPVTKTALWDAASGENSETDIWTFLTDKKGWVVINSDDESTGTLALPATDFDSELAVNFPVTADSIKQVIDDAIKNNLPQQMLCYAQLTFDSVASTTQQESVEIAIGNTATEALSSYLAETIDSASKTIIEDQLEAFLFSSKLSAKQLDVGAKFKEARHEKGFTARSAGTMWTVRLESTATQAAADATSGAAQQQITLPDSLADLLNTLNTKQDLYDQALHETDSRRRRLFSDWYKYMLCAYPPTDSQDDYPNIDEVKFYIEQNTLQALTGQVAATGELQLQYDSDGLVTAASATDSGTDSLAVDLAAAIANVIQELDTFNALPDQTDAKARYVLKQTASPRYWQPNEPVVLAVGDAVTPTDRHGQDGTLSCQLKEIEDIVEFITGETSEIIDTFNKLNVDDNFAFSTWTEQPWNPFLLEWEAELFPVTNEGNEDESIEGNNNLFPDDRSYASDFITSNYTLDENEPDLTIQGEGISLTDTQGASIYNGSSVLTSYSSSLFLTKLTSYVDGLSIDDCYTADGTDPSGYSGAVSSWYGDKDEFSDCVDWYKNKPISIENDNNDGFKTFNSLSDSEKASDPVYSLIRAQNLLQDLNVLSQSLGGFNEALVMHKQTMQLDISDPLGFKDYQPFSDTVSEGVQSESKCAPEPLNAFNPVRTGGLKLQRLRLVDTFGQIRDLSTSSFVTSEPLTNTTDDSDYPVLLPARFTQPTRLSFRWLSADDDQQEMNAHPATTPICGWFLPNNLDNSIMVYDNLGKAIGYINQNAVLQPMPGSDDEISSANISNQHLRNAVEYIVGDGADIPSKGSDFVNSLISTLDSALENIDPESYEQHQAQALLMGRPIALVRVSVDLQVQGLPEINHGWTSFRNDLQRDYRDSDAFDEIIFPVRIGEYEQFNDGLVGFWQEENGEIIQSKFHAPQSDAADDDYILTHADGPQNIEQSLQSEAQVLSMLFDPRGKLHAASGILPTKAIDIPPDQYTEALQAIEITFLTTPIITDSEDFTLSLPVEPGYKWSWIAKEGETWVEKSQTGKVTLAQFTDAFGDDDEGIWTDLINKGWLTAIDETNATVAAKDQRSETELNPAYTSYTVQIEDILDQSKIGEFNTQASFSGTQVIREGWLKLSQEE